MILHLAVVVVALLLAVAVDLFAADSVANFGVLLRVVAAAAAATKHSNDVVAVAASETTNQKHSNDDDWLWRKACS